MKFTFLSKVSIVSSIFWSAAEAQTIPATFDVTVGSCDYETIRDSIMTAYSATPGTVSSYFGAADDAEAEATVGALCDAAFSAKEKLPFEKVLNKGYQFDREYFHGNTELNSFESATVSIIQDAERLATIDDLVLKSDFIEWPDYLEEFEDCPSRAFTCCWTADKYPNGPGDCASADGCADADPLDNTDICYVDMSRAPTAARVRNGIAVFPGDSEGNAHCQGFAWDDKSDMFKGNVLFEVAFNKGLKGSGYTRAVPGAPMCGCVETMPVVSHSGCTDITTSLTLTIESDNISIGEVNDISFANCDGQDLATFYAESHDLGKYVTGDCNSGAGLERNIKLMGLVHESAN